MSGSIVIWRRDSERRSEHKPEQVCGFPFAIRVDRRAVTFASWTLIGSMGSVLIAFASFAPYARNAAQIIGVRTESGLLPAVMPPCGTAQAGE